ncbi:hypothetical protein ME7_00946 [Bartonella birtlesii LL-WM9]|uniref:Uncharacterized protein n=1 Tax=Bartonella birtlesii LL-WM9 TaxID=1094552 RepID=J1IXM6_9HYPH|nr:hypothetical protein ME7_00946 [Bartonella birtlesii LL-WM9]
MDLHDTIKLLPSPFVKLYMPLSFLYCKKQTEDKKLSHLFIFNTPYCINFNNKYFAQASYNPIKILKSTLIMEILLPKILFHSYHTNDKKLK